MSIKTLLNRIRKNTGSISFEESKIGGISGYISTGSYALNRIISGDIHKGIPNGRVIIFGGESQSGKSLIAAEIASQALNKEKFDLIIYGDSEGGGLREFFQSRGCDLNKIEHIPLESVEDATVKILSTYQALKEEKLNNPDFKALFIVDSLGGLVASKLLTDAEKGKQAQDMGLRAKLINNLVKGCTMPALLSDCSIIFINHIYQDPSSLFASKIKNQSGGLGIQYMSSITIQSDKVLQKPENKEKDEIDTFYKGTKLKFFTTKNRIVKPFYESYVFIDFDKGISKYDGLLEPAIKLGFIEEGKQGYYIIPSWNPDKPIRKTKIFDEKYEEAWESFLEKFNEKSKEEMQYSRKEFDEIKKELLEESIEEKEEKVDE